MAESKAKTGRPRPRRGTAASRPKPPPRDDADAPTPPGPGGVHGDVPVCTVAFCPICLVVTAIGDARPELIEHLMVAGKEMLLAARALIDARLQTMEEGSASELKRIRIE